MADNPATSNDLVARSLRPLTSQETSWGEKRLDDAFDQLVSLRPSIETRLDALPVDTRYTNLVIQVVCAMVLRVLNNPDGKLEEQGDDYRYRLDAAVSTGALYASAAELALLSAGDAVADGAWTIRPSGVPYGPGYWSDTTTWVPLA